MDGTGADREARLTRPGSQATPRHGGAPRPAMAHPGAAAGIAVPEMVARETAVPEMAAQEGAALAPVRAAGLWPSPVDGRADGHMAGVGRVRRGPVALYIIDSLGVGGAETLLLDLVDAARAAGYAPHVAYFTPGPLEPEFTARGVPLTRLGTRGLRDPGVWWRAYALMRRLRPAVVHTHLTKSDLVGQPAAWAAGVGRRISSLHNTDPWRRQRPLAALYRLATSGVQTRIAVSGSVAAHARATRSVPGPGLVTIDNGVDLARFDPATVAPLDLSPFLPGPRPGGQAIMGIIGRLTAQKDHAGFLEATALLAARRPGLRSLIVGDGPLRATLEADAAARRLLPGPVAFTGVIREMPALLAALDIVVFSSAWEGLPMVLLEAMAMGKPVVSTAVGAIPEVLGEGLGEVLGEGQGEGQAGLLVPPGDPAALAAAIGRLADDPDLRARMGEAARARVRARYGAGRLHARILALYGERAEGGA